MADGVASGRDRARIAWIDQARGLGIILVVFGHALDGVAVDPNGAPTPYSWTFYFIYLFHMPLFFFLSGLMVAGSLRKGPGPFLVNKLWTVVYPYLLWSLVHGLLKLFMPASVNTPVSVEMLSEMLWRPFDHFWFLYVLMACHLIAMATNARPGLLMALGVACAAVTWIIPDSVLDPDVVVHKILANMLYYSLGVFAAKYLLAAPQAPTRYAAGAACVLWALFFISGYSVARAAEFDVSSLLALPATLMGMAALVLTAMALRGSLAHAAAWLGAASMAIFILHVLPAAALRIALEKLGLGGNLIADIVLTTGIGIAAPAVAYVVLQRLGMLHWFGLAPPPKPRPLAAEAAARS
jgi:fucose 4-O-acetylase-like acetyltransferase